MIIIIVIIIIILLLDRNFQALGNIKTSIKIIRHVTSNSVKLYIYIYRE